MLTTLQIHAIQAAGHTVEHIEITGDVMERHKNNNAAIWVAKETRDRIREICWKRKETYNQFLNLVMDDIEQEMTS